MLNILTCVGLCFKFAWLIYILLVSCELLLERVELLVFCVLTCVRYFTIDNNQQLRTFDILLIYSDLSLCVVFIWLGVVCLTYWYTFGVCLTPFLLFGVVCFDILFANRCEFGFPTILTECYIIMTLNRYVCCVYFGVFMCAFVWLVIYNYFGWWTIDQVSYNIWYTRYTFNLCCVVLLLKWYTIGWGWYTYAKSYII